MRRPVFKQALLLLMLVSLVLLPAIALAQAKQPQFTNPLGTASLEGIITTIIRFALSLVGILALGTLVWGGVLYIISLGDDGRIKQAKTIIFWAIAGLVVVALASVIISTVSGFLGV